MENSSEIFDIIIVDLPDPDNEALSKLYSTAFYNLSYSLLPENGIIVTQSTSPYYTNKSFWCINTTMVQVFPATLPYHLYVPSFGDWWFNLATKNTINPENIYINDDVSVRYLSNANLQALFFLETMKIDQLVN